MTVSGCPMLLKYTIKISRKAYICAQLRECKFTYKCLDNLKLHQFSTFVYKAYIMRKLGGSIRNQIIRFIDFFYIKPFRKMVPESLFRYAFCGSANMVFDWVLYFLFYNFVFSKQNFELHIFTVSPHIAAFLASFPISFTSGFILGKYVSFQDSQGKGRVQLMRYGAVTGSNILINYLGLKLLVEQIGIFPTPSKMIVSVVCTIFSYVMQRHYTFSKRKS
jgi:putative flippase GtrA